MYHLRHAPYIKPHLSSWSRSKNTFFWLTTYKLGPQSSNKLGQCYYTINLFSHFYVLTVGKKNFKTVLRGRCGWSNLFPKAALSSIFNVDHHISARTCMIEFERDKSKYALWLLDFLASDQRFVPHFSPHKQHEWWICKYLKAFLFQNDVYTCYEITNIT